MTNGYQPTGGKMPSPPAPAAGAVTVEIARLSLQPGELLAVMVPRAVSRQQLERLAEMVREVVPDGVRALILTDGVTLAKVDASGLVPTATEGVFALAGEGTPC